MKVAAAALVGAVCAMVVRKQAPELGLLLGVCAAALILLYASGTLETAVTFLDKLAETGGLSAGLVEPVLKVTGIAIVTRLAADFCRDAKEGALSSAVETAGTALALAAVLPLMNAVLDMLAQLL